MGGICEFSKPVRAGIFVEFSAQKNPSSVQERHHPTAEDAAPTGLEGRLARELQIGRSQRSYQPTFLNMSKNVPRTLSGQAGIGPPARSLA